MPTLAEYVSDIRALCGSPDTTEVPDAIIENMINERALRWLNMRRPGKTITSFTTTEDVQDYNVKPSTAYRVSRVWWMEADFEWFSPSMRYIPGEHDLNYVLAGFSTLDNPALVEAFYKKIEAYRGNFKGTGFETETGVVRLEPTPTGDGDTVYFEYTHPRWSTAASVVIPFTEGLLYKGAELVLRHLNIKRGMIRSGRNFSGGGGANEKEMADYYERLADEHIPNYGAFFSRG